MLLYNCLADTRKCRICNTEGRHPMKSIACLMIFLFIFLNCSDNKKGNELFLLGIFDSSNSQSPPEPTNDAGSTVAVDAPELTMPEISNEPPIVTPSNRNEKTIIPLKGFSSASGYLYNYQKTYETDFDISIPPEGSAFRRLSFEIYPALDCSSVYPILDSPEYDGNHIQSITIWKKNSSGNWDFYPGEFKCNQGISGSSFNRENYSWEREGYSTDKYFNRDFSSLEKANENWLDPNSTYRILISKKLRDIKGNTISDFKFVPFLRNPNLYANLVGENSNYLWFDFKTMQSSCIKTYYDLTGGIYDYYDIFSMDTQQYAAHAVKWNYPYTPSNVLRTDSYHLSSNEIKVTGPALLKKQKSDLCASIPELCIAETTYYSNHISLPRQDTMDVELSKLSPLLGLCIKNPGQDTEYVIGYFKGFNFDLNKIKSECNGIWRNHGTTMPMYDLTKTRCNIDGSGSGEDTPVCREASGTIDVSQGKWYTTPKEEITDPKNPNKKINVSGIHTFWQNQKLIYRIKGNCKPGQYSLKMIAKNIYGPLPKNYSLFKIRIKNNRDGKLYPLEISAADLEYKSANLELFIDKGDSDLEIIWTNDVYLKGSYDSNIQIKSIILKLIGG